MKKTFCIDPSIFHTRQEQEAEEYQHLETYYIVINLFFK